MPFSPCPLVLRAQTMLRNEQVGALVRFPKLQVPPDGHRGSWPPLSYGRTCAAHCSCISPIKQPGPGKSKKIFKATGRDGENEG